MLCILVFWFIITLLLRSLWAVWFLIVFWFDEAFVAARCYEPSSSLKLLLICIICFVRFCFTDLDVLLCKFYRWSLICVPLFSNLIWLMSRLSRGCTMISLRSWFDDETMECRELFRRTELSFCFECWLLLNVDKELSFECLSTNSCSLFNCIELRAFLWTSRDKLRALLLFETTLICFWGMILTLWFGKAFGFAAESGSKTADRLCYRSCLPSIICFSCWFLRAWLGCLRLLWNWSKNMLLCASRVV